MVKQRIVPIQFQQPMLDEIETYIQEGLFSSKAEFVRDAVRKAILEMRKQMFHTHTEYLRKKLSNKGVKLKSSILTKKQKDKIFKKREKESRS